MAASKQVIVAETRSATQMELTGEREASLVAIDYLRGLAALGVAIYHVRIPLWIGWHDITAHPERFTVADRVIGWLSAPVPFMGNLVMLFFVISGFCIHWPLAGNDRGLKLPAYAARRFFRIYPAYLVAVLISWAIGVSLQVPDTNQRLLPSIAMIQNYCGPDVAFESMRQIQTNWALWSLPVEMELYAVYPLLLLALRRAGPNLTLLACVIVSLPSAVFAEQKGWPTFAPYLVIWFAGAWLAEQWRSRKLRPPPFGIAIVAILALGLGCMIEATHRFAAWEHLAFGAFYFWLVWLVLTRPQWWQPFIPRAAGSLGWLGARSYSLYLVHFPLFYLFGAFWVARFGEKPHNFLIPLLAVVLILPIVAVFYAFIERPSHLFAKRIAKRWSQSENTVIA
jgi:peptidoglycan/LPS O-acetylase OafA/YrhL